MEDTRDLTELFINAVYVQDACNLSGVVHSFARDVSRLRQLESLGTDALRTHPICVLYSSKIASLTGSELGIEFSRAYGEALRVIDQRKDGT